MKRVSLKLNVYAQVLLGS